MVEATIKSGVLKVNSYLADLEHGKGSKLKYPLGLAPSDMYAYLEQREDFNILSVFKSPMSLMFLFSMGMMFLMPKLQPTREEEKEKQRLEKEAKERRSQAQARNTGSKIEEIHD